MKKKVSYDKKYSDSVSRLVWRNKVRARNIIKLISPKKDDRILEIGCNQGSLIQILKNYSDEVFGCDINEEAIRAAQIKGLEVSSAEKLIYPSEFFDKVVLSHVIEHVARPKKALKEIERVLKRNGLCLLVFPWEIFRGMTAVNDAIKNYGNPFLSRSLHLHKFTPQKITKLTKMKLADKGFFLAPLPNYYVLFKK